MDFGNIRAEYYAGSFFLGGEGGSSPKLRKSPKKLICPGLKSFTYLGSLIHVSGSSEPEIKRRINIVHEAMFTLDQNIWQSSITMETKLRLYNTYVFCRHSYMAQRHGR